MPETTTQEVLTEEGQKVAQVLSAVQENPKLAEEPEIKDFLGKLDDFQKNGKTTDLTKQYEDEWKKLIEDKAEPEKINELRERVGKDIKEGKKISDEFLKQIEVAKNGATEGLKDSIFFGKNKEVKTDFKTVQDVIDFLDKKYSIKDINTFANTADIWRNDAQKKAEVEKEKEGYDKLFELMPEDIYAAIEAWGKGENYQDGFKKSSIDFSKSFEKHDTLEILNHYFLDKYTKDDIEDKDNEIVKKAIELSKEKYLFDKNKIANGRAEIERRASLALDSKKTSAISSVQKLMSAFPGLDKKQVDEIRQVLSGDAIDNLFLSNGVFKSDAAEKLAMIMYGKTEIEQLRKRVETLETEKEELISRKSDRPAFQRQQQPATDEKALGLLNDLIPKRRYSK